MSEHPAERLSQLYEQALQMSPEPRAAFLAELLEREPDVHGDLAALLTAHAAAPDYLERLAASVLPTALEELSLRPDPGLVPGQMVGRYRIEARLGGGGMGVVYKAFDSTLNRSVALKFLTSRGADPQARRRLIAEARAASGLDHPNIAVVYEIGTLAPDEEEGAAEGAAERLYIAMAYYEGRTLRERLEEGPLPVAEALDYVTQISAGLQHAHEAGIVHRDIKPANLIIAEGGQVKIVDFGIAKLAGGEVTGEAVTPGTVAYMSPEQTRGDMTGPQTDVWSTGVVLYEMVTGQRPFRGDSDAILIQSIRNDSPASVRDLRADVSQAVGQVIDRCLRKDPEERYADGGELREAVEALSEGPRPFRGGLRRVAWAGALALLLAVAALLFMTEGSPEPPSIVDSKILVLPLASGTGDTALARVGRELSITLSAALDGVGRIRTVDPLTMLAQTEGREDALVADEARALARRLGAGGVLVGSLVGDGPSWRADARLLRTGSNAGTAVPVRVTASGPADSLGALTDALALALVRQLWWADTVPVPSIGAVTTHSAEALRAYVEGEQALSRGDMGRAVDAFERAFEADSTFWYAYWRSLYARVYERSRADSAVLAGIIEHRDELPDRDRLLIEARLEPTLSERLAALRSLTARYTDYWPAAYELANVHVHYAPHLGYTMADSREAIERVLSLNPNFVPAWQHLLMVTTFQADSVRSREAIEALERLVDTGSLRWQRTLTHNRTTLEAMVNGGEVSAAQEDTMIRIFRQRATQEPGFEVVNAVLFTPDGFPALQIRLNNRQLAMRPVQRHAAALHMGNAIAWASRGNWDSVSVEMDRWLALSVDRDDPLRAYGLGVVAVLLGAWEPDRIDPLRRRAVDAGARAGPVARAEAAWLDGILAFAESDGAALAAARERVRVSGGQRSEALDRSLEAFGLAIRGDEESGARILEGLELEAAEAFNGYRSRHPHLPAIHRMFASRWLLAAGDTTGAVRLMAGYQGSPGSLAAGRSLIVWLAVLPHVLIEQGRVAAARGRMEEAVAHYRRIVRMVDSPSTVQGAAILEEAKAALAELRLDR